VCRVCVTLAQLTPRPQPLKKLLRECALLRD
jgi:hypothetical protein